MSKYLNSNMEILSINEEELFNIYVKNYNKFTRIIFIKAGK